LRVDVASKNMTEHKMGTTLEVVPILRRKCY
jgi:hypothetical protein